MEAEWPPNGHAHNSCGILLKALHVLIGPQAFHKARLQVLLHLYRRSMGLQLK